MANYVGMCVEINVNSHWTEVLTKDFSLWYSLGCYIIAVLAARPLRNAVRMSVFRVLDIPIDSAGLNAIYLLLK